MDEREQRLANAIAKWAQDEAERLVTQVMDGMGPCCWRSKPDGTTERIIFGEKILNELASPEDLARLFVDAFTEAFWLFGSDRTALVWRERVEIGRRPGLRSAWTLYARYALIRLNDGDQVLTSETVTA